jgi:exonuclease VII large subunit
MNNANRIKILIGRELEINNLLARRITEGVIGWLAQIGNRLKVDGEKLQLSSPVIRLKQGYAVVTDNKGKVIKDASRLLVGQEIITKYHIGQTSSEIKKITNL